ncbi:MAG: trypsin-like peptidase domain-containing protein [Elainella sp.]
MVTAAESGKLPSQDYGAAIVRLYQDKTAVGAGFCISDRYVLTCAHVVSQCLGKGKNWKNIQAKDLIGQALEIDFLIDKGLTEEGEQRETVEILPELWGADSADLAVLKLLQPRPSGARVISLSSESAYWHHPFQVFGFPDKRPDGVWTTGILLGEQPGTGWIQMGGKDGEGLSIRPGFSGAPVWDATLGAVVGMTVARDKEETANIGFMLPYAKLKRALEAVELFELLGAAGAEEIPWQRAYQRVRPEIDIYPGNCATTLEAAILQILDLSSRNRPYPPIVEFIGDLARPELDLAVQPRLICWLDRRVEDVSALLDAIKQRVKAQQSVAQQSAQSPHLLFWVQPESNSDGYEVQAYLVRDREQYDPKTAEQLQAPTNWLGHLGQERAERSDLEAILRGCLEESVAELADGSGLPDLQVHLFLPLACSHWPVDRWTADKLDEFHPEPELVGSRYRLVLRSAERFSHPDLCRPQTTALWEDKWSTLIDDSRQKSCELIPADHETPATLATKLCQDKVVGFYRTRVPQVHTPGEPSLFSALCGTGAPVAVWLRQDLPDHCRDDFLRFLDNNLVELPGQMQRIRQQFEGCAGDEHLQQHAVLIWEDPKLVPPSPSVLNPGPNQRLRMA